MVRTSEVQEEILELVAENLQVSTRSFQVGVSNDVIHRVLKKNCFIHTTFNQSKIFYLLIQAGFCRFINEQKGQNVNFCKNILFADEACLARSGSTNLHNQHVEEADENPHATKVTHYQNEFKIKVSTGIIVNFIISHFTSPD